MAICPDVGVDIGYEGRLSYVSDGNVFKCLTNVLSTALDGKPKDEKGLNVVRYINSMPTSLLPNPSVFLSTAWNETCR